MTKPSDSPVEVSISWPYQDEVRHSVSVYGSWNDWLQEHPMKFNKLTQRFECNISLPSNNAYHYKFLVDGHRWLYDCKRKVSMDNSGNINNIIFVEANHSQNNSPRVRRLPTGVL